MPWYDGTDLHLADVRVTLPDVGTFVADGDGVVVQRGDELQRVDADGAVSSYSGDVDLRPDADVPAPDLHPNDRLLQSVVGPGGMTLHLVAIDSSDPEAGTYVRLSETGRRVFVVCRDGGCVTRLVEQGATAALRRRLASVAPCAPSARSTCSPASRCGATRSPSSTPPTT